MSRDISIIVPTYNEADAVTPLVERLHKVLSSYNYEVVFVDDDSKDGTAAKIKALAGKYPVRVIVRQGKRGLATAVVDGLPYAEGRIIGVMDADLQHPPEVVPALLKAIEDGADLAVASRYVKGGGWADQDFLRGLISKGATFIAHLFLPSSRRISDPMSGFYLFRKESVDGVALKPRGYKILLEMAAMGRFGRVADVPFIFESRRLGKSKLNARQQIEYLNHIFSLMRRSGELLRFIKFCLVGGSGVVVNEGLLWLLTEHGGLFYLVSSAISIETSIVTNYTLNDFFTFSDRRTRGFKSFLKRLGKFNLVSLVGLALNWGILALLSSVLGLHYLLANLFGIAAAIIWNYLANLWWTWK
ncbi:MAG: glycosyltransferase [Dehalococcoidales bacterium]|nr:glycosyltransferase [Dehalococcoidales bacterium]